MNKTSMFIGMIFLGILGLLVILNQGDTSPKSPINNTNKNPITAPVLTPNTPLTPTIANVNLPPSTTFNPTETTKPITANTSIIKTTKGEIALTLYPKDAPNTVANFVSKSRNGFYNNLTFHRVEDWVIQGGDPLGNGTGGNSMLTEINDKPFVVGSLGVARGQDIRISNDSQFFITKKDSVFLNGQYTNFGIVIKGMDIVEKIEIGDKILQINIEQ